MTKHTGHPIQRPVATGPDELNLVLVGRMALSPDCHATARSQLVLVAVSAALCHSDLGRLCLLLNQLLIPLSKRFDLGFGFDRTFIFGELLQNVGLPTSGVQSFRLCAVLSDTCCVCFGCGVLHSSLADVEPCRGGRGTSLKDSPAVLFCVRLAFDSCALRRNTTALDSGTRMETNVTQNQSAMNLSKNGFWCVWVRVCVSGSVSYVQPCVDQLGGLGKAVYRKL